MNKKQLIVMWCWIAVIVGSGFMNEWDSSTDMRSFCLLTFLYSLIAGGLIITFRDKKSS